MVFWSIEELLGALKVAHQLEIKLKDYELISVDKIQFV